MRALILGHGRGVLQQAAAPQGVSGHSRTRPVPVLGRAGARPKNWFGPWRRASIANRPGARPSGGCARACGSRCRDAERDKGLSRAPGRPRGRRRRFPVYGAAGRAGPRQLMARWGGTPGPYSPPVATRTVGQPYQSGPRRGTSGTAAPPTRAGRPPGRRRPARCTVANPGFSTLGAQPNQSLQ